MRSRRFLRSSRGERELKLFNEEQNVSALHVSLRQMRAKGTTERESSRFMTVALRRRQPGWNVNDRNVFLSKRRWFDEFRNPRVKCSSHAHHHSREKLRNVWNSFDYTTLDTSQVSVAHKISSIYLKIFSNSSFQFFERLIRQATLGSRDPRMNFVKFAQMNETYKQNILKATQKFQFLIYHCPLHDKFQQNLTKSNHRKNRQTSHIQSTILHVFHEIAIEKEKWNIFLPRALQRELRNFAVRFPESMPIYIPLHKSTDLWIRRYNAPIKNISYSLQRIREIREKTYDRILVEPRKKLSRAF